MNKLILIIMLISTTAWGIANSNVTQNSKQQKVKLKQDLQIASCLVGAEGATFMLFKDYPKETAHLANSKDAIMNAFLMACGAFVVEPRAIGYFQYCLKGREFAEELLALKMKPNNTKKYAHYCSQIASNAMLREKQQ